MEWSIEIEALSGDLRLDDDLADSVIEALAPNAPAVSFDSKRLSVRFNVKAATETEAFTEGDRLFRKAMPGAQPVRVELETVEELDRELAASDVPDLVGVAELAALLHVSRQRASELAQSREFPKPWVVLRSGPVWKRSTVARFTGQWNRQPGRPRRTATSI